MQVKTTGEIAKLIEGVREAKGLSKNQLALKAGMARPTMLNIVNGGPNPGYSVEKLFKILDILGLKITISDNG